MPAGHIQKRRSERTGKTTWQVRIPHGRTPIVKSFEHKKDASRWLLQQAAAIDRGEFIDPRTSARPFAELVETWRETRARALAPRTRERYDSIIRKYLLPAFGVRPVGALSRADVKRYFAALDTSPGTTRKVQIVLSSILSEGVELGLIRDNVAARMRLPAPPRRHMVVLTDAEIRALAEAIPSPQDRLAVWVAAYTGLRAGEQWALRWRDVDTTTRTIRVERTLTSEHGHLTFRDSTKTEGSRRTVTLPAYVANLLAPRRSADPNALVFTSPEGAPVRHELFRRRVFNPARAVLPIEKQAMTWHDLRHSAASLLIHRGANILLVARQLGHTDPSMTLKVYGHLYPSHEAALADALDAGIHEADTNVVPLRPAASA